MSIRIQDFKRTQLQEYIISSLKEEENKYMSKKVQDYKSTIEHIKEYKSKRLQKYKSIYLQEQRRVK